MNPVKPHSAAVTNREERPEGPNDTPGLAWQMQGSNNGEDWVDIGPSVAGIVLEATTLQAGATISCLYARLSITFVAAASVVGAVTFDIQVNFDRA